MTRVSLIEDQEGVATGPGRWVVGWERGRFLLASIGAVTLVIIGNKIAYDLWGDPTEFWRFGVTLGGLGAAISVYASMMRLAGLGRPMNHVFFLFIPFYNLYITYLLLFKPSAEATAPEVLEEAGHFQQPIIQETSEYFSNEEIPRGNLPKRSPGQEEEIPIQASLSEIEKQQIKTMFGVDLEKNDERKNEDSSQSSYGFSCEGAPDSPAVRNQTSRQSCNVQNQGGVDRSDDSGRTNSVEPGGPSRRPPRGVLLLLWSLIVLFSAIVLLGGITSNSDRRPLSVRLEEYNENRASGLSAESKPVGTTVGLNEMNRAVPIARQRANHSVEYCSRDTIYGDTGRQKVLLGELCVSVTLSGSPASEISFLVDFPDSPQTLGAKSVPCREVRDGVIEFRFVDGWDNVGEGRLTINGACSTLTLTVVNETDNPWGRNILRNYGTYNLIQSECDCF